MDKQKNRMPFKTNQKKRTCFPQNTISWCLAIVLGFIFLQKTPAQDFPADAPYQLIFSDDFSGTELDTVHWRAFTPGEPPFDIVAIQNKCDWSQSSMFSLDMVEVSDGTMKVKIDKGPFTYTSVVGAPNRPCGEPIGLNKDCTWKTCDTVEFNVGYKAGLVETVNGFSYCFFEASCRVSNTPGMWPAFWMWHHDEVDLFEFFGDPDRFCNNYHKSGLGGPNSECYSAADLGVDFNNDFHVWGFEWLPDRMVFYFDGKPLRTVFNLQGPKNTPYTYSTKTEPQRAFLKKDKYFPDQDNRWFRPIFGNGNYFPIPDEVLPGVFEVDWIRIYQKKGFGEAKKRSMETCDVPFSAPEVLCLGQKKMISTLQNLDLKWDVSPNLELVVLDNGRPEISPKANTENGLAWVKLIVPATNTCPERLIEHKLWIGAPTTPVVAAEGSPESGQTQLYELANRQSNAVITFENRRGETLSPTRSYNWLKRYIVRAENECGVAVKKGWARSRD